MTQRIVIATANDAGKKLQLDEESRSISRSLRGECEVMVLTAVQAQDIFDVFDRFGDEIVGFHFAGHADHFGLFLDPLEGQEERFYGHNLMAYLCRHPQLKFIFLNACATSDQVKAIAAEESTCFIATNEKVRDQAAISFANQFYRSLSIGLPLGSAFEAAEKKCIAEQNLPPNSGHRGIFLEDSGEEEIPWQIYGNDIASNWQLSKRLSVNRNINKIEEIFPFIDRDRQWDKFEELWLLQRDYPNICLIPGDIDSRSDRMTARIQHYILSNNKGVEKFTPKTVGKWVDCGQRARLKLAARTFEAFNLQYQLDLSTDSADSILQQLSEGEVVLINMEVKMQQWSNEFLETLKWYIEDFWNFELQNQDRRKPVRIFILLHLLTPEHPGWLHPFLSWQSKYKVFHQLHTLKQEWNTTDQPHQVFPTLSKISLQEIKNSLDNYSKHLKLDYGQLEKTFSSRIMRFIPYRRKWSLREIETRLKNLHKSENEA